VLIRDFNSYLKERKSPITRLKYVNAAQSFVCFLATRGETVQSAKDSALNEYAAYLATDDETARGASVSSVRVMVYGVRAYIEYLKKRGLSPVRFIKTRPPSAGKRGITYLTRQQLSAFLSSVDDEMEPHRTILMLLPFCGLSADELCELTMGNVRKLGGNYIFRVTRKTTQKQDVPVFGGPGGLVSLMLDNYFASVRGEWDSDNRVRPENRWVFPLPVVLGNPGHVVGRRIMDLIVKHQKMTGIRLVTPRQLRTHYTTSLLSVGVPPIETSLYSGHVTAETIRLNYSGMRLQEPELWMGSINRPLAKK
jgi:integrase